MRADLYLVHHGHFDSRARAQAAIKAGLVSVGGRLLTKPSATIPDGANVVAGDVHPYVSRGGMKLNHALNLFGVDPARRVCLDIGSSTGGFTDVLLRRGAAKVYAVDVGREQLHESLRGHPQVVSMEGQDARTLSPSMFAEPLDLLVCDASFIALAKLLAMPLSLTREAVLLVKPQFELGRSHIGKGGIVNKPDKGLSALEDVSHWMRQQGWKTCGKGQSLIRGGSGNIEYLLHAVRQGDPS